MKKFQIFLLLFLLASTNCFCSSKSMIQSDEKLVGGEILKVTFSFLNESNIPLNSKNTFVDLLIVFSKKTTNIRYDRNFVVLPEKTFTFKFEHLIPEPFFGNAEYFFRIASGGKNIYQSEKIPFSVMKNSFYYRSSAFIKKYGKELSSWKKFSDNPESHFKNGTLLKEARKNIKKLLKVPDSREMLSSEDYHMLKVAKHRIGFYLKYHPMPPDKKIVLAKPKTDIKGTEIKGTEKEEPVDTTPRKIVLDIPKIEDRTPVKPDIEIKVETPKIEPAKKPVEPDKPEIVKLPEKKTTDEKDYFSTITSILPGFSSDPADSDSSDKTSDPVDTKTTQKTVEKKPEVTEEKVPVKTDKTTAKVTDKKEPEIKEPIQKSPDKAEVKTDTKVVSDSTVLTKPAENKNLPVDTKIKVNPLTNEAKVRKLYKKPVAKKSNTKWFLLFGGFIVMFILVLKMLGKKKKPVQKANRLDDDFF
ncbi:hypothetical protein KAJ27_03520 [bacterium]|nr:hypothetical protein [bacterium]